MQKVLPFQKSNEVGVNMISMLLRPALIRTALSTKRGVLAEPRAMKLEQVLLKRYGRFSGRNREEENRSSKGKIGRRGRRRDVGPYVMMFSSGGN
jgi:hypothetical protein